MLSLFASDTFDSIGTEVSRNTATGRHPTIAAGIGVLVRVLLNVDDWSKVESKHKTCRHCHHSSTKHTFKHTRQTSVWLADSYAVLKTHQRQVTVIQVDGI